MLNNTERRLGNYLLTRLLGRGGFADVYYGEHIYLKTLAAIKVLDVQISKDKHENFLMEARIAARLEHPHIVSVLEFGIENETPYLVMDYAPHGTLRQLYPKGTRLDLNQIASYVQQIAHALQYIHDRQLIHRDIKPENMLLGSNDDILLSDFGIARAMQDTQNTNSDQHIVGTIAYMAPEQLSGQASPASDQYALGVLIYEWLCGEPPFYGSYAEIAVQHALVAPMPLRERAPHIPEDIERVVMIALAKEPGSRFKSMKAFAAAFAQSCHSPQPSAQLQASPLHQTEVQQPEKRFSRRTLSLGLLGGVGLLTIGGVFAWKFFPQATHPLARSVVPSPGTTVYTYHGHPGGVEAIAWSHDSQHIASAEENIQVWYATTGGLEWIYRPAPSIYNFIRTMAWSPDNRYIAANITLSNREGIVIVETSTRKNVFIYPSSGTYSASALTWSPDNKFVASTVSHTMTVEVWNALTGAPLTTYKGHTDFINSISWSPDGKLIASAEGASYADKGNVHVWEAATGRLRLIYPGHPDPVLAVAWSPDGTHIASAGGSESHTKSKANQDTVQIWKPDSEKPLLIYRGHAGPIGSLSWSPDSKALASSNGTYSDGGGIASIQVWNTSNGHTILTYQGEHPVSGLAGIVGWSPDGNYIASSGFDGAVQVWKAP